MKAKILLPFLVSIFLLSSEGWAHKGKAHYSSCPYVNYKKDIEKSDVVVATIFTGFHNSQKSLGDFTIMYSWKGKYKHPETIIFPIDKESQDIVLESKQYNDLHVREYDKYHYIILFGKYGKKNNVLEKTNCDPLKYETGLNLIGTPVGDINSAILNEKGK